MLSELELPSGAAGVMALITRPMSASLVTHLASSDAEELEVALALRLASDLELVRLAPPPRSSVPPPPAE